jgi:hypothetical protein
VRGQQRPDERDLDLRDRSTAIFEDRLHADLKYQRWR